MSYKYVSKGSTELMYINGYAEAELPLEQEFPDLQKAGIHFYRCRMKAGATYSPQLEADKIVMLVFNGKAAYIRCGNEKFEVTEPAFFIPEFAASAYTIGALEDIEFIKGIFDMNAWDREQYRRWHKHLPFFTLYSSCTEYGQDCKLEGTRSWTVLQGLQLGHISAGVVRAVGAGTDEVGHPEVHQWNYCLGESDFTLDVEEETEAQEAGDFSFIYAGRDHKLLAKPGKEVFYVWIEYYTVDDLTEFFTASITNRSPKEAYKACLAKNIH